MGSHWSQLKWLGVSPKGDRFLMPDGSEETVQHDKLTMDQAKIQAYDSWIAKKKK